MAPWLIPVGVEAAVAAGEGAADVAVGAAEAGSDIAIGMGDAAETSASLIARGVVKRLAPKVVKDGVAEADANDIKAKLEAAGATVELK